MFLISLQTLYINTAHSWRSWMVSNIPGTFRVCINRPDRQVLYLLSPFTEHWQLPQSQLIRKGISVDVSSLWISFLRYFYFCSIHEAHPQDPDKLRALSDNLPNRHSSHPSDYLFASSTTSPILGVIRLQHRRPLPTNNTVGTYLILLSEHIHLEKDKRDISYLGSKDRGWS